MYRADLNKYLTGPLSPGDSSVAEPTYTCDYPANPWSLNNQPLQLDLTTGTTDYVTPCDKEAFNSKGFSFGKRYRKSKRSKLLSKKYIDINKMRFSNKRRSGKRSNRKMRNRKFRFGADTATMKPGNYINNMDGSINAVAVPYFDSLEPFGYPPNWWAPVVNSVKQLPTNMQLIANAFSKSRKLKRKSRKNRKSRKLA